MISDPTGWPYEFPIRRTLLALLMVPPVTLLIPTLVWTLTHGRPGEWDIWSIQFPAFILIFSWSDYVRELKSKEK